VFSRHKQNERKSVGLLTYLAETDLEQRITSLGTRTVLFASAALAVLTLLAILLKKRSPKFKLPIFLMMATAMIGTTITLFAGTVYLNMKSESGGPVHWHADIEFWACGAELELRDPIGLLSNKIGTATFHEHNDKRIHLEGVVVKKKVDASLEKFMRVSGGYLTDSSIGIPLGGNSEEWFASGEKIDGDKQHPENYSLATGADERITQSKDGPVLALQNGKKCSGGDEALAEVQVFVYSYDKSTKTYSQHKLEKPTDYTLRDESVVPPGDCVIVEFDSPKSTTDKLCQQYGVRDAKRCVEFGVKEYNPELCNIREVRTEGAL
jgi:hypothetical protein